MFKVIEYISFYAVQHIASGLESAMGDGVDQSEQFDIGTEEFRKEWEDNLNANKQETLEAYFGQFIGHPMFPELGQVWKHRHVPRQELKTMYPLILRSIKSVLLGTDNEALSTLECYRMGIEFGCEACSHSGLTTMDRLKQACSSRYRNMVREYHKAIEQRGYQHD